jgi:hypothetical protein
MKKEIAVGMAFVSNDELGRDRDINIQAFLQAVPFILSEEVDRYELEGDGVYTELTREDYEQPSPSVTLTAEQLEPFAKLCGERRIKKEVAEMIEGNRKALEQRLGAGWVIGLTYGGWDISPRGAEARLNGEVVFALRVDYADEYWELCPRWDDLRRACAHGYDAGIEAGEENVKASLRNLINVKEDE